MVDIPTIDLQSIGVLGCLDIMLVVSVVLFSQEVFDLHSFVLLFHWLSLAQLVLVVKW